MTDQPSAYDAPGSMTRTCLIKRGISASRTIGWRPDRRLILCPPWVSLTIQALPSRGCSLCLVRVHTQYGNPEFLFGPGREGRGARTPKAPGPPPRIVAHTDGAASCALWQRHVDVVRAPATLRLQVVWTRWGVCGLLKLSPPYDILPSSRFLSTCFTQRVLEHSPISRCNRLSAWTIVAQAPPRSGHSLAELLAQTCPGPNVLNTSAIAQVVRTSFSACFFPCLFFSKLSFFSSSFFFRKGTSSIICVPGM